MSQWDRTELPLILFLYSVGTLTWVVAIKADCVTMQLAAFGDEAKYDLRRLQPTAKKRDGQPLN